jgi:3-oxoadipate enol-lactonase
MASLQLPGTELYYEVEGDGIPVVLVHGHALDTRMWDDQVPALTEVATAVRYDARGFGRSTRYPETPYSHADDLWRLVDHLGIESAVLVGLSMGGRTVVEATLAVPERVRALVLLDALLEGVRWDPESKRGMDAIGEELRAGGLDAARAALLRHGFFTAARRDPDVARRLTAMIGDFSGAVWTEPDPHLPHPPSIELLGTITVATTVVVGELDVPCFHEMSEVLADRIPGARLVTVPDAGHMINMEAPETVNTLLREIVLEQSRA